MREEALSDLSIELTPDERELLERIELDQAVLTHATWSTNGEHVVALMRRLVQRGAIPEHRQRYFDDAAFNPGGRGRSRRQEFERNGCRGADILRHAHFLEQLRYILHGPDLPPKVIKDFRGAVEGCGGVTSGDIRPLGKRARQLVRAHGLDTHAASEEFYKLSLDLELGPTYARFMRQAVR